MASVVALLAVGGGLLLAANQSKKSEPEETKKDPPRTGPTSQQIADCQRVSGFSASQCAEILGAFTDPSKIQAFIENELAGAIGDGCQQAKPGTGEACERLAKFAIQKFKDLYCLFDQRKVRDPWQAPGLMRVVKTPSELKPGEIFIPAAELQVWEDINWGALKRMPFTPTSVGINKGFAISSTVITKDGLHIPVPIDKSYINWVGPDRASGHFKQFTGRARGSGRFVKTLHLGNVMLAAGLARRANDVDIRKGFKPTTIIINETNYKQGGQQGLFFKVGHTVGC